MSCSSPSMRARRTPNSSPWKARPISRTPGAASRKNKLALAGLMFIAVMILAAIFIPMLSPYTYDAQDFTTRNAGFKLATPVRHRQVRPRHTGARYVWRAHIAVGRLCGGTAEPDNRRGLRRNMRLYRRQGRPDTDANSRHTLFRANAAVRDTDNAGVWLQHILGVAGDKHKQLGRHGAAGARAGHVAQGAGVRSWPHT